MRMAKAAHPSDRRAVGQTEPVASPHRTGQDDLEQSLLDLVQARRGFVRLAAGMELAIRMPQVRLKVKRALDIVLGSVLILLSLPLFVAVAAAIKLSSPGPVFFRHVRVGRAGRQFPVLKFRTMVPDAPRLLDGDPSLTAAYVVNDYKVPAHLDPRLTGIGRLLRITSLDELPQLVNVVLGHMSLVGPRPVEEDQVLQYGPLAPAYLAVRPGLTGAWQVGGRSLIGFPERAVIDFDYVHSWSLLKDLAILARTIPAVVTRRGAY